MDQVESLCGSTFLSLGLLYQFFLGLSQFCTNSVPLGGKPLISIQALETPAKYLMFFL